MTPDATCDYFIASRNQRIFLSPSPPGGRQEPGGGRLLESLLPYISGAAGAVVLAAGVWAFAIGKIHSDTRVQQTRVPLRRARNRERAPAGLPRC